MENKLVPSQQPKQGLSVYSNTDTFENAQRFVKALQAADILPDQYKNNTANCLVALDYAWRLNVSPLTVMDNLHIIKGKRSWSAQFIAGLVNSCGRFSQLRYKMEGGPEIEVKYVDWDNGQKVTKSIKVPNLKCHAYSVDLISGDALIGPIVSTEMAVKMGWWTKKDSNWPHTYEAMLMYRAASYFGRMYAADLLMGMSAPDEMVTSFEDVTPVEVVVDTAIKAAEEKVKRTRKKPIDELNAAAGKVDQPAPDQTPTEPEEERKYAEYGDEIEDAEIEDEGLSLE